MRFTKGCSDMRSPTFLLYGISGVHNFGCEAIVRGTELILREIWPDSAIKYASARPEYDSGKLVDTGVQIVPRQRYSRYSVRNICRKAAAMAGSSWTPIMENLEIFDDNDVVLSIGGDRYTMRPRGAYPAELVKIGEYVLARGIVFVVWGASVGPFNTQVAEVFASHLKRTDLITSREVASTAYLASLGVCDNVVSCADPAYLVDPQERLAPELSKALRIGINLSPLSSRVIKGKSNETIIAEQSQAIAGLVRRFGAEIVLIPHVIDAFNNRDDDLGYLRKLQAGLPKDVAGMVVLFAEDGGFLGAKTEIRKCHLVLAARMHCAINAIASGVPTILLAYSQKAGGMAEYVYGDRRWVLPIEEFASPVLVKQVQAMLDEIGAVAALVQERLPLIRRDAKRAGFALAERLAVTGKLA